MTPEECIEFLARVEGSLNFRREGQVTIVTAAARGFKISHGFSDTEKDAALFNVTLQTVTNACTKLDNRIGS